jgi:hypothetical protein
MNVKAAAFAAVLLALLLDGSAAAKRTPPPLPKKAVPGRVEALAFDGTRVAYDIAAAYGKKTRCNAVWVWNPVRNTTTRVSGHQTCGADNTSTGAGVRELAVAGNRVAWIVNQGGNSESADYLYTSTVSQPKERILDAAFRQTVGDSGGPLVGNSIGGLVGSGSFLGVNRWFTGPTGATGSVRLQRITARLSDLAEGPDTKLAQSTDGKLLAVLRDDQTVGIYSTAGTLLRSVTPTGGPTELALRGDFLVALTTANRLEVFNTRSGRLLHSWRVPAGARFLDVSSGLAAYAAPRAGGGDPRVVHLKRLSNGKDRIVATTPRVTGVQLEPGGLVYAVNRIAAGQPGYLVFVPMKRLPKPPLR